jgi:hypothetical protein
MSADSLYELLDRIHDLGHSIDRVEMLNQPVTRDMLLRWARECRIIEDNIQEVVDDQATASDRDSSCVDCGFDTIEAGETYMLHDNVWEEACAGAGLLCIGCVEQRIGRQLTPSDFVDCPLNRGEIGGVRLPQSDRLRSRLQAGV